MRLFAPTLAFVDLETTGTAAGGDAITEIGVVRVSHELRIQTSPAIASPQIASAT